MCVPGKRTASGEGASVGLSCRVGGRALLLPIASAWRCRHLPILQTPPPPILENVGGTRSFKFLGSLKAPGADFWQISSFSP